MKSKKFKIDLENDIYLHMALAKMVLVNLAIAIAKYKGESDIEQEWKRDLDIEWETEINLVLDIEISLDLKIYFYHKYIMLMKEFKEKKDLALTGLKEFTEQSLIGFDFIDENNDFLIGLEKFKDNILSVWKVLKLAQIPDKDKVVIAKAILALSKANINCQIFQNSECEQAFQDQRKQASELLDFAVYKVGLNWFYNRLRQQKKDYKKL